jgi:threonine dehydrogenase-like Zn-dependent dehydrogenase
VRKILIAAASYPPRTTETPPSRRGGRKVGSYSAYLHFGAMKVGVIGLGYVGLPLAVAFAEAGRDVVGLDSDPRVVDRIRNGASAVEDMPAERLTAAGDRLRSTTDHDRKVVGDAALVLDFRGITRGIEASNLVRL